MAQSQTFLLPDLGEGLTEAELVSWHVAEGDVVEIDQVIAEVETAKSLVEVPSPYAGTVLKLHGAEGETMLVDKPLITVGEPGAQAGGPDTVPDAASQASAQDGDERAQSYRDEERAGVKGGEESEGSGNVLIGYGTSEDNSSRRRRRGRRARGGAEQVPQAAAAASAAPAAHPAGAQPAGAQETATQGGGASEAAAQQPAQAPRVVNPLVRKLARDCGVDVRTIVGTGPDGVIVRADVLAAQGQAGSAQPGAAQAGTAQGAGSAAGSAAASGTAAGVPAGADEGETDSRSGLRVASRTPMTGVRKVVAETMSRSRREIPEATVWVDVDVTDLLRLRKGITPDANGRRPGILAIVGRFVAAGLMRVPALNSRVEVGEDGTQHIVQFDGVNLGIAAQTDRGLVVPAVEHAERLNARQLDAAIAELVKTARDGKASPAQLMRGTFTLNNYGVFDVDGSAAIINYPQAAILGLGRIKQRPWVVDGEMVIRDITEITLSFDHRVCDGGEASEFLRFVADAMERPGQALAEL